MNAVKIITLTKPLKSGDMTVTELSFAEPTIGHLAKLNDSTENMIAKLLDLAVILTGIPRLVLDNLGGEDWCKVRDFLLSVTESFVGTSPIVE